jgi:hypothetical protein
MMSEDSLLHELGRLAKEEDEAAKALLDERWDRLAAGTLSAEEDEALRALATRSPAAREAYEAFRPLGAEFQARMVTALAAELRASGGAGKRFRLLPFRPRGLQLAGWLSAASVAATGLLLLLRGPAAMAPLPGYFAQLSGGVQTFRGGQEPATGAAVFEPGSRLSLVVRPEHSVTDKVEARGFLERGAEIVPWQPMPRFDISPEGAVRLQGTVGKDIFLPPGVSKVWIVVGRRGSLPAAGELVNDLRAGRTRGPGWQAVAAELRVAERPPPGTVGSGPR